MHVSLTSPKYLATKASHSASPKQKMYKQEIENEYYTSATSFTCAIGVTKSTGCIHPWGGILREVSALTTWLICHQMVLQSKLTEKD